MVRRRSFSSSVQRRHILDRCRSIFIHYASTRPAGRLESLSPAATPASQYNEAQRNNAFCPRKHRDHAWKDDIQRHADERYRQAESRSALARAVDGGSEEHTSELQSTMAP